MDEGSPFANDACSDCAMPTISVTKVLVRTIAGTMRTTAEAIVEMAAARPGPTRRESRAYAG